MRYFWRRQAYMKWLIQMLPVYIFILVVNALIWLILQFITLLLYCQSRYQGVIFNIQQL